MKWLSIIFGLVTLGLVVGLALSLVQAIQPIPTPAEVVKAAGKIDAIKIDLRGSSFSVFGSHFQDDKIKVGHYNASPTSINDNQSKDERPGIQASLENWANRVVEIPLNVNDKITKRYSQKNASPPKPLGSYTAPPVIQMTPPGKKS